MKLIGLLPVVLMFEKFETSSELPINLKRTCSCIRCRDDFTFSPFPLAMSSQVRMNGIGT